MALLKIATFNIQNLYSRFARFGAPGSVAGKITGITSIEYKGGPASEAVTLIQRNNTARAILDLAPDILAVQEVDNLWTLRCFNDEYLGGYFDRMLLFEGNDPRGIDVGLCIRSGCPVKIEQLRTHIDEVNPAAERAKHVSRYYSESTGELTVYNALFSRDCLEVDITAEGIPLTFLINHFKSQDGKKESDALRNAQANRVVALYREQHARGQRVIVVGDLNADYAQQPSLKPLRDLVVETGDLVDPIGDLPDHWTHFYAVTGETSRLDYILVDRALRAAIRSPVIHRKGISLKCASAGDRYPTIGYVDTEASDHCPVMITLDLDAIAA